MLNIKEAAALLGVSRATAYRLVHTGALPCIRIANSIRIFIAHVHLLLSPEARVHYLRF